MKRKKPSEGQDGAGSANAEYRTFENALDAIIRTPKTTVDRQMAEQHPKRPKKSPRK